MCNFCWLGEAGCRFVIDAGWVQAIGVIAAIFFSYKIGSNQSRYFELQQHKARIDELERMRQLVHACKISFMHSELRYRDVSSSIDSRTPFAVEEYRILSRNLAQIPLNEMPSNLVSRLAVHLQMALSEAAAMESESFTLDSKDPGHPAIVEQWYEKFLQYEKLAEEMEMKLEQEIVHLLGEPLVHDGLGARPQIRDWLWKGRPAIH